MTRVQRFMGLSFAACALLSLVAGGCEDPKDPVRSLAEGPPVALEDALLYVASEDDAQSAWLLDLQGKSDASRSDLPDGTVHAYARPDHPGEAVLLSEGKAAALVDGEAQDAVPSYVLLFDRTGETQRFELASRYSALGLSDDGRFAIAYATSGAWSTADNIAIVDLDNADPKATVASTSVRALDGSGPSAVAFAPSDGSRRVAVLVMTDAVNIVDLEHPDLHDKVLPLKLPNAAPSLRASKVLFMGDFCFVQADSSSDVLLIRFEDDDSDLGYHAALSTLGTESTVQDIALLDGTESAPRLLALGSGSVRTVDALSGDGDSSSTMANFSAAHVFQGKGPFDDEVRERALLYAPGDTRLGFVDLQKELPGSERGVDLVQLSSGLAQVVFPESQTLAVVAQNNGTVSLVDLEQRTVSSLTTGGGVRQLLLDERDDFAYAWVLTEDGSVGTIDLVQRSPTELLLEEPATFVLPVVGDTPHVAVGQSASDGSLVLFDASAPSRATAQTIDGFRRSGFLK